MKKSSQKRKRDYRAENARSSVGRIALEATKSDPSYPVSFYQASLYRTIRKALGSGKARELANSRKLEGSRWRHLAEISRVDPRLARKLGGKPDAIEPTYRKYRSQIQALKTRRVSAEDRFERAWPGVWQRWLEKFEESDFNYVRKVCALAILGELDESERHEIFQRFAN